jgi:hypothetical protein
MFIPDPDLDFLLIPDPGSGGQKGPGSGSETLDGTVSRYDPLMVICGESCRWNQLSLLTR